MEREERGEERAKERVKRKMYSKEGTDANDLMVQAIEAYRIRGGIGDDDEIVKNPIDNKPQVPIKPFAKEHNVTPTAFRNRLLALANGEEIGLAGRQSILTTEEEEMIVEICMFKANAGFPMNNKELRNEILEFYKTKPQHNEPKLYDSWLRSFHKRHNDVLTRRFAKCRDLQRGRKPTREKFELFYDMLEEILQLTGLKINDPNDREILRHILWNADETGVCLSNQRVKVICQRGDRNPVALNLIQDKSYTTMLVCGSASGSLMSPLLIYRTSTLPKSGIPEEFKSWKECEYRHNKCGWITKDLFEEWFETIFIPEAKAERDLTGRSDIPIILTMDNHSTHIGTKIRILAIENNIKLLTFPAHCSHLIQPLDLNFFGAFKNKLSAKIRDLYPKQNTITKAHLSNLLQLCWSEIEPKWLIKAFEMSGMVTDNGINRQPEQISNLKLFPGLPLNGIVEYEEIFNFLHSQNQSTNTLTANHMINSISHLINRTMLISQPKQSNRKTATGNPQDLTKGFAICASTSLSNITPTKSLVRTDQPEITPERAPKAKKIRPKRSNKSLDFVSVLESHCIKCLTDIKTSASIKCDKCRKCYHINCIPNYARKGMEINEFICPLCQ